MGNNIFTLKEQSRKTVTNDIDNSNNLWMEVLKKIKMSSWAKIKVDLKYFNESF